MLERHNCNFYRAEMLKSNCSEVPECFGQVVNWQWEAESLNPAKIKMVLKSVVETLIPN